MKVTDLNQLRFNQGLLAASLPLALVFNWPWLVAILFLLMVSQHLGLDGLVWLRRRLGIAAQLVPEDPAPHRFARSLGAVFLGLSSLCLMIGLPLLGWVLGLMVAVLALLSLTTRICVGCFLYLHFRLWRYRLGGS